MIPPSPTSAEGSRLHIFWTTLLGVVLLAGLSTLIQPQVTRVQQRDAMQMGILEALQQETLARTVRYLKALPMGIPPASIPDLLDLRETLDSLNLQETWTTAMLLRWAEEDLEATLGYLLTLSSLERGLYARDLFGEVQAEDAPGCVAWMETHLPPNVQRELWPVLVGNLARQDPRRTREQFLPLAPQALQQELDMLILQRWAQVDAPGAARQLEEPLTREQRERLLPTIAQAWVVHDPDKAQEWLHSLPMDGARDRAMEAVSHILVQQDPLQALHFLDGFPRGERRDLALRYALRTWGKRDPGAAVQWAQTHPDPSLHSWAIASLAEAWAGWKPAEAMEHLLRVEPRSQRERALLDALGVWASREPGVAAHWWSAHSEELSPSSGAAILLQRWMAQDRDAALAWWVGLPAKERLEGIRQVVEPFWKSDPEEASQLVLSWQPAPVRQAAIDVITDQLYAFAPLEAARLALKRDPLRNRDSMAFLAGELADTAPGEAWKWTQQLPVGRARDDARTAVLRQFFSRDPLHAEALLKEMTWTEKDAGLAASSSRLFGDEHPEAAARVAGILPEGPVREAWTLGWMQAWSRNHPAEAAATWETLSTEMRSRLAYGLALDWIRADPATAVDWALKSVAPRQRLSALQRGLQAWQRIAHDAAMHWLRETPMDPTLRERLQASLELP